MTTVNGLPDKTGLLIWVMQHNWQAIQVILLVIFPAVAYYLAKKNRVFDFLGPVLLCYFFGMLLRNTRLFPVDDNLSETIMSIAVPLAIPMLLFSVHFMQWVKLAGKTILAFSLALISVVITSAIGSYLFQDSVENSWAASGMLVGVFSGGTPNMTSIGKALNAPSELFVLLNASDTVLSGLYLLFLLSIAKKFLSKFFRPFKADDVVEPEEESTVESRAEKTKHIALTFGLAIAIVVLSAAFGFLAKKLFPSAEGIFQTVVILGLTTFGIVASFQSKVRAIRHSFATGEYIILIFCVAIGTMTDFEKLFSQGSTVFYFTMVVLYGAIVLHYILCYLFKIDVDTMLITSTAAVFSPAFVPAVADAMQNRAVILSGLTSGLIGFALGNYLGIFLGFLLKG